MVAALKKATETLGYEKARVVSKLDDQVFLLLGRWDLECA